MQSLDICDLCKNHFEKTKNINTIIPLSETNFLCVCGENDCSDNRLIICDNCYNVECDIKMYRVTLLRNQVDVCSDCHTKMVNNLEIVILQDNNLAKVDDNIWCNCGPNEYFYDDDIDCQKCGNKQCGFTMYRLVYTTADVYKPDSHQYKEYITKMK